MNLAIGLGTCMRLRQILTALPLYARVTSLHDCFWSSTAAPGQQ